MSPRRTAARRGQGRSLVASRMSTISRVRSVKVAPPARCSSHCEGGEASIARSKPMTSCPVRSATSTGRAMRARYAATRTAPNRRRRFFAHEARIFDRPHAHREVRLAFLKIDGTRAAHDLERDVRVLRAQVPHALVDVLREARGRRDAHIRATRGPRACAGDSTRALHVVQQRHELRADARRHEAVGPPHDDGHARARARST